LTLLRDYSTEPMIGYRTKAASSAIKNEPDSPEMWEILNYFELIGVLVQRNYLEKELAWEMFAYYVFPLYLTTKDIVAEYATTDINTMTNFNSLHKTLVRIERAHNGTSDTLNGDDVRDFWEQELSTVAGAPAKKLRRRMEQKAATA
jgi:hypothetical protein